MARDKFNKVELASEKITKWIGSEGSILLHTLFFIGIFILREFNFSTDEILLILTTAVSLEAIYLAIFIQMTVNRHTESLEEVGEDIEDIQEDVAELSEDVDEISEDIQEIQEEDETEEQIEAEEERRRQVTFEKIETALQKLMTDIESLKKDVRKE